MTSAAADPALAVAPVPYEDLRRELGRVTGERDHSRELAGFLERRLDAEEARSKRTQLRAAEAIEEAADLRAENARLRLAVERLEHQLAATGRAYAQAADRAGCEP